MFIVSRVRFTKVYNDTEDYYVAVAYFSSSKQQPTIPSVWLNIKQYD